MHDSFSEPQVKKLRACLRGASPGPIRIRTRQDFSTDSASVDKHLLSEVMHEELPSSTCAPANDSTMFGCCSRSRASNDGARSCCVPSFRRELFGS